MSLLRKLAFYPTSLALRLKLAAARSLLRGPFCWHALDRLGIPGWGTDLLRLDFLPALGTTPAWGHGRPVHPELAARIDATAGEQAALLANCLATGPECRGWPGREDPSQPALPWRENEFLTPFDAFALHGMLHHARPERYLEIGSGLSTRVAWQARRSGGFPMEIISVDPEPRRAVAALCDRVHRCRLEEMDVDFLRLVTPRTVVFFDGSHRSFPGSDVTSFFLNLLPRLPTGALVHIHDIYLPSDYPARMFSRFWSEQYLLAAYLLGGGRNVEVILPLAHLAAQPAHRGLIAAALGTENITGSSFWLRVT